MKVTMIIAITLMIVAISLASEEEFTVGNRNVTVKLFKEILKNKTNKNIIFAPITVQILMAILTSATTIGGPAIEEIKSVMELPSQKDEIHEQFRNITEALNVHDDDFKMFNAIKILFGDGFKITKWFRNDVRKYYNASMGIMYFKNPKTSAARINTWVAERTNDKIHNFIQPSDISFFTKTLMINALYLMGKWDVPFKPHETEQETFYILNGTKQVHMMKVVEKGYLYFENSEAKYLKIGLFREGGGADMVFVLPHKQQGLGALVQDNLHTALFPHAFYPAKVTVDLPKFKITNDVPLKPVLQNLGINGIFDKVLLDGFTFSGSVSNKIGDVFQKALIEIDESGVTAISATDQKLEYVDLPCDVKNKEFKADHPFLFYIRVAEVIVYAGQVVEP